MTSYELNSKIYKSLDEIAALYNMSTKSLRHRLDTGLSLEDTVLAPIDNKRTAIKVKYKNIEFKSINEACKFLGVSRPTINNYINKGYSFEDAVDMYIKYIKDKEEIKNKKLKESAEKTQRALDKQICINGIYYKDIKFACSQLGISDVTVRKYVREKGMSHVDAIYAILNKIESGDNRIGAQRKYRHENEREIARQYGLHEESISKYRNRHNDYSTSAIDIAIKLRDSSNVRKENIKYRKIVENERNKKYPNLIKYAKLIGKPRYKICEYAERHPELSEQQIIDMYEAGGPRKYKKREQCDVKEMTEVKKHEVKKHEVIYVLYNSKKLEYKNLRTFCIAFNLNYELVKYYKRYHNISSLNAIIHYRPDCYININGELIIPTEEE